MLGLLTAVEGPALPGLAENTASTLDRISLIFVFGSLGYLLGSLFSGQAYDRLPGHRLIAFTLLLITICATLVPFRAQPLVAPAGACSCWGWPKARWT